MTEPMKGLTNEEALIRLTKYGKNEITPIQKSSMLKRCIQALCEPMFLLLLVTATVYFLLGQWGDGTAMLIFIAAVMGIDIVQEWKTDKTLLALNTLCEPTVMVIRDGKQQMVDSRELVPGDIVRVTEGDKIPADGRAIQVNDFCVDESSLTGESESVWKTVSAQGNNFCYAGTFVLNGSAYIELEQTGRKTEYGKISESVSAVVRQKTPLQKQTGKLVKLCAALAGVLFILATVVTAMNLAGQNQQWSRSFLSGVTLAIAVIPEEFPVILTVFLAMGAWRLSKRKALIRSLPAVETLGAISALCVDKTGTLTENKMCVKEIQPWNMNDEQCRGILRLACETDAYDPMEQAILAACGKIDMDKTAALIGEYPFTAETKMMGHIWEIEKKRMIMVKGAPENVFEQCAMTDKEKKTVMRELLRMTRRGYRVVAAGMHLMRDREEIPESLAQCTLTLCGLVALEDAIRPEVKENIAACRKAGIKVFMITGDYGGTAVSIARQAGITADKKVINGNQIDSLSDEQLREAVKHCRVFARVMPQHKMRLIQALQRNGEVTAMTGDGVNDAPALKCADIGIAMGKRGTQAARESADLILTDDNFSTIVKTIQDGRHIYDNIRKAFGYVITIHIPIILSALLAPILHIAQEALLFLPIHIVLMELMIDPTCSVVFERQPDDADIMERKPRNVSEGLLSVSFAGKSIMQGTVLCAGSFLLYWTALCRGESAEIARTMGICTLILANLFLVFENSTEKAGFFQTACILMKDKVIWGILCLTLSIMPVLIYTPVSQVMRFAPLTGQQVLIVFIIAFLTVFWYEGIKCLHRKSRKITQN